MPQSCHEELARLRALLIDRSGRDKGDSQDFKVDWQETRLRVERMDTSEGAIYVCRRYGVTPRRLADLGFPPMIAQRLLATDDKTGFREGLVAFLGRTGSGKSTAAAAYIIERLEQSGGVCWTAENPIELALQGRHGKGVCYQLEVADDYGFGEAIRHILRASPNLILIGEIRDKTAAQEAIHAALTGHLVVTTLHANDLLTGLARLARLAGDPVLLADALRRVLAAGIELDGASDHGVSEALYLRDPDENGVELYWDRPREKWPRTADGGVEMYTRRLDLEGLLKE